MGENRSLMMAFPFMEAEDVLSLMIVDDEFLVRIGIRETIAWSEHGFFIAGEAENGEEGLELAQKIRPDIIITDIRMPNMDGLEFMARLKTVGIGAKIIVLSGYNEFDYAREALKHGALAYLLKPIENHQLLETVLNAGRAILAERELQKHYSDLEQEVPSIIKYKLIRAIEGASVLPGPEALAKIGFPLTADKIAVVLIIDEYDLLKLNYIEKIGRIHQAIAEISGMVYSTNHPIVLEKENGQWVVLLVGDCDNIADVHKFCQEIISSIYAISELTPEEMTFSLGISNRFLDVTELPRAYGEALRASKEKLIPKTNSIIHISTIHQIDQQDYLYQAIAYLKNNYAGDITVEMVANYLSLSPSYLMHLFKSRIGKTFGECLTEYRICVAKELLRKPGCKIYEISDRVGYKDPKYFSQIFKRSTGLTPREYMRMASSSER